MTKQDSKPNSRSKRNTNNLEHYFSFVNPIVQVGKVFYAIINSLLVLKPAHCHAMKNSDVVHQNTSNLKHHTLNIHKSTNNKLKRKPNVITIDLRKLENKSGINDKEKNKIKRVLKNLIVENGNEMQVRKEMCRKEDHDHLRAKRCRGTLNYNIRDEIKHDVSRCMLGGNTLKGFGKQNSKPVKVHEVFKRYNYDAIDTPKLINCAKTEFQTPAKVSMAVTNVRCSRKTKPEVTQSVSSTRTIIRAKPNINVANMRVKYVNPICLVQYSSGDKEDYSRATLKAHLGEGQCPLVNDPHTEHALARGQTVFDEEDENYVIAKGTLTEELVESFKALKEIRQSLFPEETNPTLSSREKSCESSAKRGGKSKECVRKSKLTSVIENEVIKKTSNIIIGLPSPVEYQQKPHWDVESFPSTLQNLEKDALDAQKIKTSLSDDTSLLNKVKMCFFNTCLCLCFGQKSGSLNKNNYPAPEKQKIATPTKKSSYRKESNVRIVRTTESDFFYNKHKDN